MFRDTPYRKFSGRSVHGLVTPTARKPLHLYFEVTGWKQPPVSAELLAILEQKVQDYGVSEINFIAGHKATQAVTVPGFEQLAHTPDPESLVTFRTLLQQFKAMGLIVTLQASEPQVPEDFFTVYPEARNVTNMLLWRYIEERTQQIFRQIPEVDCLEIYPFESNLLSDQVVFKDLWWANDGTHCWEQYADFMQIYSQADYLTETLAAFSRGASSEGKAFSIWTFSHYPWEERMLIEALQGLDHNFPVILDHGAQPGDWDPFRPLNNVLLQVTDRGPSKMKFDGCGEYWGQGQIPYCYPEEIQQRLRYALAHNPSIESIGMRIDWADGHLFNTPNEINFFALSRLAQNPEVHIEAVWQEWGEREFGARSAAKVVSALRRTNEIGNLTYYFRGAWVHQHSHISSLHYCIAQLLHTGRAQIEWAPWNFRDNALIQDLIDDPREYLLEIVLDDRREALHLCELSLAEIEAVKQELVEEKYQLLHGQLLLQHRLIEMSLLHIEVCLRYWIQRKHPVNDNLAKIAFPLQALSDLAGEIEMGTQLPHPLFTVEQLRTFVTEVRDALAELPAATCSY